MKPIRPGVRGAAVEDVQRRLRTLGYDLGPTGVDGAFMGLTLAAVRAFQAEHGLDESGLVGDQTWSALVDATFKLGDRMLYLRLPHFHGRDVRELQEALNVLGFASGAVDGIFGACTETAVREFQRNTGLHADGITGAETVEILSNLRHIWEGKGGDAHSEARKGPVRSLDALSRRTVILRPEGDEVRDVAGRVVNLALAGSPEVRVSVVEDERPIPDAAVVLRLVPAGTVFPPGLPVVRLDGGDRGAAARLATAFEAAERGYREIVVEIEGLGDDPERAAQRAAVALLDALCDALA